MGSSLSLEDVGRIILTSGTEQALNQRKEFIGVHRQFSILVEDGKTRPSGAAFQSCEDAHRRTPELTRLR